MAPILRRGPSAREQADGLELRPQNHNEQGQAQNHQEQVNGLQLGAHNLNEEQDVITISDDEETAALPKVSDQPQAEKAGGSGLKKRQLQQNRSSEETSSFRTKRPRLRFLPSILYTQRLNAEIAKSKSSKRFSCHICERTFWLRSELKKHIESGQHKIEAEEPEVEEIITISDDESEAQLQSGDVGNHEQQEVGGDHVEEVEEDRSAQDEAETRHLQTSSTSTTASTRDIVASWNAEIRDEAETRRLRTSSTSTSASTREIIASWKAEIRQEEAETRLQAEATRIRALSTLTGHSDNEEESLEVFVERIKRKMRRLSDESNSVPLSQNDLESSDQADHLQDDNLEDDNIWIAEQW